MRPDELLERWERELEFLRECGATEAATTRARDIRELREWWTERELDALTLGEAAEHSGLSAETIRKKVAAGELPNAGRKGAPRVLRRDLPTKPAGRPRYPDAIDFADQIIARRFS